MSTLWGAYQLGEVWETLDNTIQNKADHLYFIIDEAHRGAKSKREAGKDTTIMQRFIKGYEYVENGIKRKMRSMPVILGISATAERFNTLVGNTTNVGLQKYVVTADEVRSSGLPKDRIAITYPEDPEKHNDMVLLEAAVEEWLKKCKRWYQYTSEQHYANVDPVLVVQVRQGSGGALSDTNLEDVLAKIEEKVGTPFKAGEVVHCFGEGAVVEINGLRIPHVKASEIADDHKIRVVFFKEALSTGWDCPRAETMMSFAVRHDPTYIAQLLGRMVRTPLQMRVMRDEFLNDVKLYLPYFDKDTVKKVVDELQSNEGGDIPTEINGESLEEPTYVTWTVHTPRRTHQVIPDPNQLSIFDIPGSTTPATTTTTVAPVANTEEPAETPAPIGGGISAPEYNPPQTVTVPAPSHVPEQPTPVTPAADIPQATQLTFSPEIDRVEIIDFINAQGYMTYLVRKDRINDYLKSLASHTSTITHMMLLKGEGTKFSDMRLRQAVSMAIDRQLIVDQLWNGYAKATQNLINRMCPDWVELPVTYDLEQAKALAKEVLGDERIPLDMYTRSLYLDRGPYKEMMEYIQSQLSQIGIDATVNIIDSATYKEMSAAGQIGANFMTHGMSNLNAYHFLDIYMSSEGTYNKSQHLAYSNPEVDALLAEMKTTLDDNRFHELAVELQEIANEELPILPLFYDTSNLIYNKEQITGYEDFTHMLDLSHLAWVDAQ